MDPCMKEAVKSLHACRKGSTPVEYALIAVIISICIVLTASHIGTEAQAMYDYIISSMIAADGE